MKKKNTLKTLTVSYSQLAKHLTRWVNVVNTASLLCTAVRLWLSVYTVCPFMDLLSRNQTLTRSWFSPQLAGCARVQRSGIWRCSAPRWDRGRRMVSGSPRSSAAPQPRTTEPGAAAPAGRKRRSRTRSWSTGTGLRGEGGSWTTNETHLHREAQRAVLDPITINRQLTFNLSSHIPNSFCLSLFIDKINAASWSYFITYLFKATTNIACKIIPASQL